MTKPNEELIAALTQTNQFHEDADICTADVIAVLQSQAERIKELEAEIITRASYGDEQTDFAIKLAGERDALRAQLAEVATSEPSFYTAEIFTLPAYATAREWVRVIEAGPFNVPDCRSYQPLFTRPMPAQDVKDAKRYRWLAAYLVSDYTEHDDALIDCSSVEAMSAFIDAKGAK